MDDERRGPEPGRRKEDWLRYCPEHSVRVEMANERHKAAEGRDAAICGKVSSLKQEVNQRIENAEKSVDRLRDTIVGRWTFWVVIGLMFSSIGVVGFQQHWAFSQILENQRDFGKELGTVADQGKQNANRIDGLTQALEALSRRQDVLRNQNIKLMDKLGMRENER
jgi:hypothetical protein